MCKLHFNPSQIKATKTDSRLLPGNIHVYCTRGKHLSRDTVTDTLAGVGENGLRLYNASGCCSREIKGAQHG